MKFQSCSMNPEVNKFVKVSDFVHNLDEEMAIYRGQSLQFGVSYLDMALRGIERDDFIVVGAAPGAGKTELSTMMALHNAMEGKRVHFFALEAGRNEIEKRMLYKGIISRVNENSGKYNYYDWLRGDFPELEQHTRAAAEELNKIDNLSIYYRDSSFTPHTFKQIFTALNGKSDLIVVDHLHYFDFDNDNENKAIAEIVKQIRDMVLINEIPVILVAHLRKAFKATAPLVPELDDFHGTSEIGKIATKAIILSPGDRQGPNIYSTYVRVGKCRQDGSVTKYVAQIRYNSSTSDYENGYKLGILSANGKEFKELKKDQHPNWSKGAIK